MVLKGDHTIRNGFKINCAQTFTLLCLGTLKQILSVSIIVRLERCLFPKYDPPIRDGYTVITRSRLFRFKKKVIKYLIEQNDNDAKKGSKCPENNFYINLHYTSLHINCV